MIEDFYRSKRDAMGGWAAGDYICTCTQCRNEYLGDRRSTTCAKCAWHILDDDQCIVCEEYADELFLDDKVPPDGDGNCLCKKCKVDGIAECLDDLETNEVARLKELYFTLTGNRYI